MKTLDSLFGAGADEAILGTNAGWRARPAGDVEYASWRQVMLDQRHARCPDGAPHSYSRLTSQISGYFFFCRRCDHHSPEPF